MTTKNVRLPAAPPSQTKRSQTLAKRLLTIAETGEVLGLSRSTVYELIASDDLEVVHIGRSVRIPIEAVDTFVDRLRSRTAS